MEHSTGMALHKMIRAVTMVLGGEGYLNFMVSEWCPYDSCLEEEQPYFQRMSPAKPSYFIKLTRSLWAEVLGTVWGS